MFSFIKNLFRKRIQLSIEDDEFKMLDNINVEVIRWNSLSKKRAIKIDSYSDNLKVLIEWCTMLHQSFDKNALVDNIWINMDRTLTTKTLDSFLLDGRYELTHDNLEILNLLTKEIKEHLMNPTYANLHDFYRRAYFSIFNDLIAFNIAVQKL